MPDDEANENCCHSYECYTAFFWETTSEYVGYDDHADDDALHKNLKNNLYSQLNI